MFNELENKVCESITVGDDEIIFRTVDGDEYIMHHHQDCCEDVHIEEIHGDIDDIVGTPILFAEETSKSGDSEWGDYTWTFYKLATVKGHVTIRWYGESNGYYSTEVSFHKK